MREILRAFIKTTSGTIISLLLSTVTVKILAVFLGPSTIGLVSLLRQIYSTTLIAATLSGQTALVQGGSTREGDDRIAYLRTVLVLFLVSSLVSGIVLLLLAPVLAQHVLNRQDATAVWLIRLLTLPLVFTVINGFSMGVLNIQRHLGQMAIIQIVAAGCTAVLAYPIALFVQQGHEIALLGTVLFVPLITFGLALYSINKIGMLRPLFSSIYHSFRWDMAKAFYSFAGVTVVIALIQSGIMLLVRSMIVHQSGLAGAGIFDAAWTLSMTYVTLITTAFGTYYLPTLSGTTHKPERLELMQRMFRFVTILVVPLTIAVILLKPFTLHLLFSAEFLPAVNLMSWMLIGDFFKLTSWVKAYPMLAFADLKLFLWSEVSFHSLFLAGAFVALNMYNQMEGVATTFCIMYIIYYVAMSVYSSVRHGFTPDSRTQRSWWIGLFLVLLFSIWTWHDTHVNWALVAVAFSASVCYVIFSLDSHEWSAIRQYATSKLCQQHASHPS